MFFDELDLDYDVLDAIEEMGFREMTPVQEQTIPVILRGNDLIGCAQTGTGKTAAFALPLLSLLMDGKADGKYEEGKIKSIIMVPTRELAMQIDTQFQGFSYYMNLSTTVVYGGGDGKTWDVQRRGLDGGADVVVATPGRLLAHLEGGQIDLSGVKHFILDEADRMLDMGFFDDIMKVVQRLPKERQTILFSATLPPKIRKFADQILSNPTEISIAISKPAESIDQGIYMLYESQKMGLIKSLFDGETSEKAIIFSSSKLKVKDLAYQFKRMKLNVGAMHSDLDQAKREEVMLEFKSGKINILVATDIVARGIDIDDIGIVINYDVPHDPEDYIHRIGRTGRASATGRAMTFVSEKEQGKFRRIEEFLEREIKRLELPSELGDAPAYNPTANNDRGGRGGRGDKRGGRSSNSKGGKGGNKGGNRKSTATPTESPAPSTAAAPTDTTAAPQQKRSKHHRKPKPKVKVESDSNNSAS
ncbi:MAG: DEAD/DEAH box helicase [Rikenellaceae bacterium]